jgi:hypothetical protein
LRVAADIVAFPAPRADTAREKVPSSARFELDRDATVEDLMPQLQSVVRRMFESGARCFFLAARAPDEPER